MYIQFPSFETQIRPKERPITVLTSENDSTRYGITGISYPLTAHHIGQQVLRAAPGRLLWSFVPYAPTREEAEKSAEKLVNILSNRMIVVRNAADRETTVLDDGEWITLEDYCAFINTHNLENYPPQVYRSPSTSYISSTSFLDDRKLKAEDFVSLVKAIAEVTFSSAVTFDPKDIKWVNEAVPMLPKQFVDYQYPFDRLYLSTPKVDNEKEKNARDLLGLRPDEKDLKSIERKFRIAAFRSHPDRGGDEEKFKELVAASTYLLSLLGKGRKKETTCQFTFSSNEETYQQLLGQFNFLKESENSCGLRERLSEWANLYVKLRRYFPGEGQELFSEYSTLMKYTRDKFHYYQVASEMLPLKVQKEFQEKEIEDLIEKVKAIAIKFDLTNKKRKWAIVHDGFAFANRIVVDAMFAFHRSLCHLHLSHNKQDEAIKCRTHLEKWHFSHMKEVFRAEAEAKLLKTIQGNQADQKKECFDMDLLSPADHLAQNIKENAAFFGIKEPNTAAPLFPISVSFLKDLRNVVRQRSEVDKAILDRAIETRKLGPLHVAILSWDHHAARLLLEEKADPNEVDNRNWSPLHHAAMIGDEQMMKLLKAHHPIVDTLNNFQGLYQDVVLVTAPIQRLSSALIPLFYRENSKEKERQLNAAEFEKLTGAVYLTESHISRKKLFELWLEGPQPTGNFPFADEVRKMYDRFAPSPRCIIQKESELTTSILGLHAKESIPALTLLGDYLGIIPDLDVENDYVLAHTDAQKYRNEMAQINDGFVNVVSVNLLTKGLPRHLFITAEEIPIGEQICWNYGGAHRIKLGPYAAFRFEAAQKFVQSEDFDIGELTKLLIENGTTQQLSLSDFMRQEKFRYLIQTPPMLFLLIQWGSLNAPDAIKLAIIMSMLGGFGGHQELNDLAEVGLRCHQIYEQLLATRPRSAESYRAFWKSFIARQGIKHTLAVARRVNQALRAPISNSFVSDAQLSEMLMKLLPDS